MNFLRIGSYAKRCHEPNKQGGNDDYAKMTDTIIDFARRGPSSPVLKHRVCVYAASQATQSTIFCRLQQA